MKSNPPPCMPPRGPSLADPFHYTALTEGCLQRAKIEKPKGEKEIGLRIFLNKCSEDIDPISFHTQGSETKNVDIIFVGESLTEFFSTTEPVCNNDVLVIISAQENAHVEIELLMDIAECKHHPSSKSKVTYKRKEKSGFLFRAGIIADTQYFRNPTADKPVPGGDMGYMQDGASKKVVMGVPKTRYYRHGLCVLEQAVENWIAADVSLCIHLGDILDKQAKQSKPDCLDDSLSDILEQRNKLPDVPWYFALGNNDFQCFSRKDLHEIFVKQKVEPTKNKTTDDLILYHEFSPFTGFRFLFLDPYDISDVRGAPCGSYSSPSSQMSPEQYLRGGAADDVSLAQMVFDKNGQTGYVKANVDGSINASVVDTPNSDMKYKRYNGAIGKTQLDWLMEVLNKADQDGEKCFLFSHLAVHPDCCRPDALVWNDTEILQLLGKYTCVQAVFSGHDHDGGFVRDPVTGIYHVIPSAPIECDKINNTVSFGVLEFYPDFFKIVWEGKIPHTLSGGAFWPTSEQQLCYRDFPVHHHTTN